MDDGLAFSTFSDVETSDIISLAAFVEETPKGFSLPGVSLHIILYIRILHRITGSISMFCA